MRFEKPLNYAKWDYDNHRRYNRYVRYVENMPKKLVCQECGGSGSYTEPVLDYGEGPKYNCGFCWGTGYITPYMRGLWLKWKKEEKRVRSISN